MILNTILILGVLQYIVYYALGKPKSNTLSCGIFGASANTPYRINPAMVKILGLFNESRGKTSCGITYDDEIYHGIGTEKLFTDFCKGKDFTPEVNPNMFGHTRQASVRMSSSDLNAHPFGFGVNVKTGGFKFIGVHNGTLYNHEELAEKYEISTTAIYLNENNVEATRTKIDSEILLEILYRTKSYDVLSDYIGRAALVWQNTTEPNVIYLWSGKSRSSEHYKAATPLEERPMNVWVEDDNRFYFSSITEPLAVIGGDKKDIFQIDYNTVYKVTNGDFMNAETTAIDRSECWHTETVVNNYYGDRHYGSEYSGYDANYCGNVGKRNDEESTVKNKTTSSITPSATPLNIYEDKPELELGKYGERVYNSRFRYFRNGHLITGVYCYITKYGFKYLSDNIDDANKMYDKLRGVRWINNEFDYTATEGGIIPFPTSTTTRNLFWFVDGIRLQAEIDYKMSVNNKSLRDDLSRMSWMSVDPIIDMKYTWRTVDNQNIIKKGVPYTGTVTGLSYEKTYNVVKGKLTGKSLNPHNIPDVKPEGKLITLPAVTTTSDKVILSTSKYDESILEASYQHILNFENEFEQHEKSIESLSSLTAKINELENSVDQKVDDLFDNEITPCIISFQNVRDELDLMPQSNQKVSETKSLMQSLIATISNFIK